MPPLSSTLDDRPLKLRQPKKTGLASHEAKLSSPGATRSTVLPLSLNPPELSELMLLLSQPVVAK